MNQNERDLLSRIVKLFVTLPREKQYYLLGYAQAEADKNAHECRENS